MTLSRLGGWAAFTCGATYLFGFALLVTVLAPLGFGSNDVDPAAVVAFNAETPGLLTLWNSLIYVLNALALAVLVVALARRLEPVLPDWASVSQALGLIWAALVLGAGMVANVALERADHLYATDPAAAAELWTTLHAVELGLGGGNEIAGGVWIGVVSLAALRSRVLPLWVAALGLLTSAGGLANVFPPVGDVTGAIFGLGAIAWFLSVGAVLILARGSRPASAAA